MDAFPERRTSARKTAILVAGILLASLLAVLLFTRRSNTAGDRADTGHSHASGSGAALSSTTPVMLSATDARRIGVTFAPVTLAPFGQQVRAVAQVTYDETRVATIAAKFDGYVEQLFVNYTGQQIAIGQPLFAVYSPMLVAAQEELLVAANLSSSLARASGETRASSTQLQEAARRRLRYWDVSPAEISAIERTGQVKRTLVLRSPVSGVVLEKSVVSGQRVMAGESLYKVADLRTVWLEGEVFERDLPGIRIGAVVRLEFEALPGEQLTGRISYLYPTVNSETRTMKVRVVLNNPGMRLKPGMYGTIVIDGALANVVSVPRSAVLSTGERNIVFVQRADGMLEPRNVAIGESFGDRTRILSGVAVGESVVSSATFLIDAESNLKTSLGGMGDMPGMDVASPAPRKE